jgi:general secretion pathway protein G
MKRQKKNAAGGSRAMAGWKAQPAPSPQPPALNQRESGFTLLELLITLAIVAVLTAGTIPVAKNMIKREKEMELRRNLRELRKSIDAYKIACDGGKVSPLDKKIDDECYPKDLQILVDGINPPNTNSTIRFLRRIPEDPFTGNKDWGTRSIQDDPDSTGGGGENVFDVFSKAPGTALDGSKYSDW